MAKAKADLIVISGAEGGTGASPASSIRYAGISPELGLSETQQTLVLTVCGDKSSYSRWPIENRTRHYHNGINGRRRIWFCHFRPDRAGMCDDAQMSPEYLSGGVATQNEELRKRFHGAANILSTFSPSWHRKSVNIWRKWDSPKWMILSDART